MDSLIWYYTTAQVKLEKCGKTNTTKVKEKHYEKGIPCNGSDPDSRSRLDPNTTPNEPNVSRTSDGSARQWNFQENRIQLRIVYMDDLKKILPGKMVGRLMQLENRTDLLIDMDVASNVPLIK